LGIERCVFSRSSQSAGQAVDGYECEWTGICQGLMRSADARAAAPPRVCGKAQEKLELKSKINHGMEELIALLSENGTEELQIWNFEVHTL
jgi:hypothetical protein